MLPQKRLHDEDETGPDENGSVTDGSATRWRSGSQKIGTGRTETAEKSLSRKERRREGKRKKGLVRWKDKSKSIGGGVGKKRGATASKRGKKKSHKLRPEGGLLTMKLARRKKEPLPELTSSGQCGAKKLARNKFSGAGNPAG